MPDSNCIFVVSTTNNNDVTSSYMALPFLPNVSINLKYVSLFFFAEIWEVICKHEDFNGLILWDRLTIFVIWPLGKPMRIIGSDPLGKICYVTVNQLGKL